VAVAEQPHGLLQRREHHGGGQPVRLVAEGGDAFAAVRDELAFVTEERYAGARYRSDDEIRISFEARMNVKASEAAKRRAVRLRASYT